MIIKLTHPDDKENAARALLPQLPDWFGNDTAKQNYYRTIRNLDAWVSKKENGDITGLIVGKIHHDATGDIYLMAVAPQYHRQGIGRLLIETAEIFFAKKSCKRIVIKTLSDTVNYAPYLKTCRFYEEMGYEKMITFDEFWDEQNPCLLLIKDLK